MKAAGSMLTLAWLAAGCAWGARSPQDGGGPADVPGGTGDQPGVVQDGADRPPSGPVPTHQGFDQVDPHGAVRISYLDDPILGFDFDGRHVVYSSYEGFMYLVDLQTEQEVRLYPPYPVSGPDWSSSRSSPRLAGDGIVSRGADSPSTDVLLFFHDFSTLTERVIALPYVFPDYMDADGTRLVFNDRRHWDEDGGWNMEVYLYDFAQGQERRLSHQPKSQFLGGISGGYVVWEHSIPGTFKEKIELHDLASGQTRRLTEDDIRQFAPRIHGDLVVWTDFRNGTVYPNGAYTNADVYLYRISTGEEVRITTDPHDQEYPFVHGKWIAWTDLRHGSRNQSGQASDTRVYVHDLDTGTERPVSFGQEMWEGNGKVWGDRLVYQSCCLDHGGALWLVDLERYIPAGGAR